MHYDCTQAFELNYDTMFQPYQVQVPGKLYLAGEYAVLEPGHPAILMAIDRYLTCQIRLSHQPQQGSFESDLASLGKVTYQRDADGHIHLVSANDSKDWQYILAAIETFEALLVSKKRQVQDYHLSFTSQMQADSGQKYGLGSSGAVTVATMQALCHFYGWEIECPLIQFKLVAIAMAKTDSKSSLGDVAANITGGMCLYRSLDRQWLNQRMQDPDFRIDQILGEKWPHFYLEPLFWPEKLSLHVGWTQSPASSDQLVTQLKGSIQKDSPLYHDFLTKAQICVQNLAQAIRQADLLTLQKEVSHYRHLLVKLDRSFQLNIETPSLKRLIEVAHSYQFEAKSSGAGGGDCGIAIGSRNQARQALYQTWQQEGIQPLAVGLAPFRFSVKPFRK
ncbi:phosphomevalonate kinase [Vaginisenegalia massiliensis]|uniref:phosphomevalonate kinase n=1 Tax=Vaginisenegalia massiliensis TaxID=2058294 RepID=UPI000F52ACCA|nr:phosphomevalonate kinase [Vaginisenegalia massiliensis]